MYSVVLLAALSSGGQVADCGHRRGGYAPTGGCYGGCGGYSGSSGYAGYSGGYVCGGGVIINGGSGGYVSDGGVIISSGCFGGATGPSVTGPGATGTGTGTESGTGTGSGTGGGATDTKWPDDAVTKIKGLLKGLEISEADADALIAGAKDAGDTADSFSKFITETVAGPPPDGLKQKGKEAKATLEGYIKTLKKALGGGTGHLPLPQRLQSTIVVNLPADASLSFDGVPTSLTSSRRVFVTLPLEADKRYEYKLTAEAVRQGYRVTWSEKLIVQPGLESQITLTEPVTGLATR